MQNTRKKRAENSKSDSALSFPLLPLALSCTRHPKKEIIISALSVCMIQRYIESELVPKSSATESGMAKTTNHAYQMGGLVGNRNRIENRLSYF